MPQVRKTATPHPDTVTRAAEIALEREQARRRALPRRTIHIETIKIDERVWKEAMRLADGNMQRIEVISATEVVVHNHPQKGNIHG